MPPTWPLTTSCPLNPFNPPNQPSPDLELTLRLKTRSQLVAQDPIAARGGSLKAAVAPFPPPAGHIWGFSPKQRGGRFPDRPGTPSAGGAGGETKDRAAVVVVVVWRPPAPLRSAPVPRCRRCSHLALHFHGAALQVAQSLGLVEAPVHLPGAAAAPQDRLPGPPPLPAPSPPAPRARPADNGGAGAGTRPRPRPLGGQATPTAPKPRPFAAKPRPLRVLAPPPPPQWLCPPQNGSRGEGGAGAVVLRLDFVVSINKIKVSYIFQ